MSLTPEVFQRPMDRLKALAFKNIIPGWATPLQNIRKHFRYLSIIPSGLENKKISTKLTKRRTRYSCWLQQMYSMSRSIRWSLQVLQISHSCPGRHIKQRDVQFQISLISAGEWWKPFCKTRRSRQRDFFWFPTCKGMFTAKLRSFYAASSVGKCPR